MQLPLTSHASSLLCLTPRTQVSRGNVLSELLPPSLTLDPAEYPWARRVECAIIDTKSFLKSDEDVYTSAESYDCTRLAADLVRLREQPCAAVSITGGPTIEAKQRLVLLHGPHVLCREGEWAALDGLFDLTLDLTLCDYDVTSSRDYEDDVAGAFVPEGVSPRVLQAQMQFMSWQEKCASDVSFSLPLEAGTVVFLPETITIAPPLRRSAWNLRRGGSSAAGGPAPKGWAHRAIKPS